VKSSNARALSPRVANQVGSEGLLRLEHSVYAFGRDNLLAFERKNERGILPVEDNDIDLVAKLASAIDDMRGRGLVSLRQVGCQEVEPDAFAGVALAWGVTE
jgi:hypothetical protein